MNVPRITGMKSIPHLTKPPDISEHSRDAYKDNPLLKFGKKKSTSTGPSAKVKG